MHKSNRANFLRLPQTSSELGVKCLVLLVPIRYWQQLMFYTQEIPYMAVGESGGMPQEWGSLVPRPHPPSSREEKGSGVTSSNLWASSRSVEWPMKSQSNMYWNNSEVRISTLIVPLKATLWIQYPPILTNLYSTLTITRLLHFGKPKDLDLWHQTASPWPEVIKRLRLSRPSLGHLANPDFLKEGTVVTCPASEPRLHILKPYSAFLLSFAQHCKSQKARRGLQCWSYEGTVRYQESLLDDPFRGRCKN